MRECLHDLLRFRASLWPPHFLPSLHVPRTAASQYPWSTHCPCHLPWRLFSSVVTSLEYSFHHKHYTRLLKKIWQIEPEWKKDYSKLHHPNRTLCILKYFLWWVGWGCVCVHIIHLALLFSFSALPPPPYSHLNGKPLEDNDWQEKGT